MNNTKNNLKEIKVLSNPMISNSSGILSFKRCFKFTAGQVISVTNSQSIPPRLYSIISAEKDDKIEILYKIIPEGRLTPELEKSRTGDSLWISPPFGKFLSLPSPAWLIATGTGIAPFISMLRSGYDTIKMLLHGSRYLNDFYFSDYLGKKLSDNYIRCYTGKEDTQFYKGRVTNFLNEKANLHTNI